MNSWKRPAVWAAMFGWINVFGLSWVVALRWIEVNLLIGLIWVLFFLFSIGATAMASESKRSEARRGRGTRD